MLAAWLDPVSRPRVQSCETVPSARPQRTPAALDAPPPVATPTDPHIGRYLPGQLGRFPTIGIDPGAIPGTRPDQAHG